MVSQGFPDIELDKIADTPGAGDAFVQGWRAAYVLVTIFSALGLLLAFFTKPRRETAEEDG
jgi:hypothetical protein